MQQPRQVQLGLPLSRTRTAWRRPRTPIAAPQPRSHAPLTTPTRPHAPLAHSPPLPGRELWRQAAGRAIRNKFPKYTVTLTETEDFGKCEVAVKYTNGREQTVNALHLTLLDIFDVMSEVTEEILEKEEADEIVKG